MFGAAVGFRVVTGVNVLVLHSADIRTRNGPEPEWTRFTEEAGW